MQLKRKKLNDVKNDLKIDTPIQKNIEDDSINELIKIKTEDEANYNLKKKQS